MTHKPHGITVTVVVSTVSVSVTIKSDQSVEKLMKEALKEAGQHPHGDVSGWVLRSATGDHEFSPAQTIAEAGIVEGATLFLNKDAGGGG
jgi:hypothetical protein